MNVFFIDSEGYWHIRHVWAHYLTNRITLNAKHDICVSVFHSAESQKGVSFSERFCSQTTDVSDVTPAVCFLGFFLLVIVSQTHLHVKGGI